MEPHSFKIKEVRDLFGDKKVVFLGDSIMREIYKDFVWLHSDGKLIPHDLMIDIKDKERNEAGEPIIQSTLCEGERLIPGTGVLTDDLKKSSFESRIFPTICLQCLKCSGRHFKEEREYVVRKNRLRLARFYFLTKCWSDHLEEFLLRVKKEDGDPDVILILSCLWDTNRWSSRVNIRHSHWLSSYIAGLSLVESFRVFLDYSAVFLSVATPAI